MHSSTETTVFCRTQKFEPSCGICLFLWNSYVFLGILRNSVLVSDIVDKYGTFWSGSAACKHDTPFHHEIHGCHSGFNRRNTENIELSLFEILQVYLVDRLYLSVAVTGDKYCIFGRIQGVV